MSGTDRQVLATIMIDQAWPCPACGLPATRQLLPVRLRVPTGEKLRWEIRHCASCTHRFLPTTEAEQRAIEHKYGGEYKGYRIDTLFEARVREEIESQIRPVRPPPGLVLDVGCGNGAFLRAMAEYGYTGHGIEVSDTAVERCLADGLNVTAGDFLATHFDDLYDVISMWDVVEHLRDPEAFISRAWGLLKPGGLLVLKIPGFGRWIFPPIRIDNRFAHVLLGAPGHVQYFNRRSLRVLLTRCGIEAMKWPRMGEVRRRVRPKNARTAVVQIGVRAARLLSGSRNLYVIARRPDSPCN